jgi:hypothetical protein
MKQRGKLLISLGAFLLVGGLLPGLGGIVIGMIQSFNQTQSTGTLDNSKIAQDVSLSFAATTLLVPAILLGILLILVGLFLRFFRKTAEPQEIPMPK